jgi:hypothetical protein
VDEHGQYTLAIVALAAAGLISLSIEPGAFNWWHTMVGLLLLGFLVPIARGTEAIPIALRLGFSGTLSLAMVITFGIGLDAILNLGPGWRGEGRDIFYIGLWLLLALIIVAILRVRKGKL